MGEAGAGGAGGAADGRDVDALSFEELVEELERTIERMSSGALGIEEVTTLYERAGILHAAATDRLARIQERIEKLTGSTPS